MVLHNAINNNGAKGYFASANSAYGFYSVFGEIYNEKTLDSLYILKGGPGTGKSTLISKVAEYASGKGYETEVFLCSSDPSSLDGIVIKDLNVAVVDGTSPHTCDPMYPGVCGEIIDLGECWDTKSLKRYGDEIIPLFGKKSDAYRRAYRFLKSAGEAEKDIIFGADAITDHEKADKAVSGLLKKYSCEKKHRDLSPKREVRFTGGFGNCGRVYLNTLYKTSGKIVTVSNEYGSGQIIMDKIKKLSDERSLSSVTSPSPLLPEHTEALYLYDLDVLFALEDHTYIAHGSEFDGKSIKKINSRRFIKKESLAENRAKIRFSQRILSSLIREAENSLYSAGEAHRKAENFYISAMDFGKTEEISEKLIKKIFSR